MVMEEQQTDMELDSERVPVPQVQQPLENLPKEIPQKVKGIGRAKPRFRKKMLHAAIVKQMEFYFGDANLSKDRYLSKLINEDPYVDLSIFTRFNKIRDLTTDVHRIAKALQTSTMLSVSEDGTKVRRVTPLVQRENVEECSVYVQNLPPDADHEWLSSIFSQYGPIAYISIPKYKSNKKIKGFAFVEFETPKDAVDCLKAYKKKGYLLPSSTSPNELLSITTYEKDKDVENESCTEKNLFIDTNMQEVEDDVRADLDVNAINNQNKGDTLLEENKETLAVEDVQQCEDVRKKTRKRKHKDIECQEIMDVNCPSVTDNSEEGSKKHRKRKKRTSDEHRFPAIDGNESTGDEQNIIETHPKCDEILMKENCKNTKQTSMGKILVQNEDLVNISLNEEQNVSNDTKKKRKKRKKRSKIEEDNSITSLQVMAKKDWKHLRNKYLELQRNKMKQLKQHLRKARWNQWTANDKPRHDNNDIKEEKEKPIKSENSTLSFVPGVIVKIEMNEQCTDPKKFKAELRGNTAIKFVDISDGSYEAFIRCDNADSAKSFILRSNQERSMSILKGEEEQLYWEKILRDREEKLGNKNRPKQRGRDKLLKKAEKELGKHIKFDEV